MKKIVHLLGKYKSFGTIVKFLNMSRYSYSIRKFGATTGSTTGDFERGNKPIQEAYERTNMQPVGILPQVCSAGV